jgi:hypothetical protein
MKRAVGNRLHALLGVSALVARPIRTRDKRSVRALSRLLFSLDVPPCR